MEDFGLVGSSVLHLVRCVSVIISWVFSTAPREKQGSVKVPKCQGVNPTACLAHLYKRPRCATEKFSPGDSRATAVRRDLRVLRDIGSRGWGCWSLRDYLGEVLYTGELYRSLLVVSIWMFGIRLYHFRGILTGCSISAWHISVNGSARGIVRGKYYSLGSSVLCVFWDGISNFVLTPILATGYPHRITKAKCSHNPLEKRGATYKTMNNKSLLGVLFYNTQEHPGILVHPVNTVSPWETHTFPHERWIGTVEVTQLCAELNNVLTTWNVAMGKQHSRLQISIDELIEALLAIGHR